MRLWPGTFFKANRSTRDNRRPRYSCGIFPGVGDTHFRPSDRCEIPCSSELAEPLVINVTKLVLAICRSISHIQETNAPSEEVRVHFTDVRRPNQQFLTCIVKWTYQSQDEIEEHAENGEPIKSVGTRVTLTCGDSNLILEKEARSWKTLGVLGCKPFARAMLDYFKRNARKYNQRTAPAVKVRCACAIKRLDFDGMNGRLDIDNRAHIGSVEFHHVPTYIHGEPSLADENDLEHVYSMSDAFLTLVMMGGS